MKRLLIATMMLTTSLFAEEVTQEVSEKKASTIEQREGMPTFSIGNVGSLFKRRIFKERSYEAKAAFQQSNYNSLNQYFQQSGDSFNDFTTRGVNVGVGVTNKLTERLSFTTMPNFTYMQQSENQNLSRTWKNNVQLQVGTMKLSQTVNYALESKGLLFTPFFEVGLGYGIAQLDTLETKGGDFQREESTVKGLVYDVGLGMSMKVKSNGITPFVKVSYQGFRVSSADINYNNNDGAGETTRSLNGDAGNFSSVNALAGFVFNIK